MVRTREDPSNMPGIEEMCPQDPIYGHQRDVQQASCSHWGTGTDSGYRFRVQGLIQGAGTDSGYMDDGMFQGTWDVSGYSECFRVQGLFHYNIG